MSKTMQRMTSVVAAAVLCFSLIGFVPAEQSFAAGKIHLKKTTVSLNVGETYLQKLLDKKGKTIKATKAKWKSSRKSVATITKGGKIRVVKAGTVKMTVKYNGKTYRFTVKVLPLKLKSKSVKIGVTQTYQQKLLKKNGKAVSASKVTWKSSNASVAKITSGGKVTALKAGTAKMTAKYCGKTYSFTVNVPKISIVPSSVTLKEFEFKKVKIMVDNSVEGRIMAGSRSSDEHRHFEFEWVGNWIKQNDSTYYKEIEIEGTYEGLGTLVAYAEDDETIKNECKITVKPQINDVIGISVSSFTIKVGQSVTLTVHNNKNGTMYPSYYEDIISCKWGSMQEDDYSYHYDLTVTGLAVGKTYLTIYDKHDDSVNSTVLINVVA